MLLESLRQRVSVRRDARGVPYIDAANEADAYFVQGYVTASDRLWQMDLFRRTARGEVAEILGQPALDQDKHFRAYGFSSIAAGVVAATDPVLRGIYSAYADGVNAFIAASGGGLPLEFQLLNYRPSPWLPEDCIIVGKLTSEALGTNWPNDLMRALFATLPAAILTQLFRQTSPLDTVLVGSDVVPITVQPAALALASIAPEALVEASLLPELIAHKRRRAQALRRIGLYSRARAASNNWVVSGAHTHSGKPLLANDPHLSPSAPSLWYMAHLRAPNLAVAGVTIPGIPGIMLGHNEHIAWGVTNMSADVQEICKETIDPQNSDRYLTPDGWQAIDKRTEHINVRRSMSSNACDVVDFDVRATRNGPLVIDQPDEAYSLRWFSLEDTVDEYGAFYWIDRASDWATFRDGLRRYKGPPQNFLYADTAGNIGYQGAGLAPARANVGLPVDGAKVAAGDMAFLSLEEMPYLYNPPSGFMATANNRVIGLDFPHPLTRDWSAPYRSRRIVERLLGGEDHTVEASLHIQGDTYSYADAIFTGQVVKLAEPHAAADPTWAEIYNTFKGWDAKSSAETTVMSIAATMRNAFSARVLIAALGQDRADTYSRWPGSPCFIDSVIDQRGSQWLPQGTASYEALILASYDDAIKQLTSSLGPDRTKWTWSQVSDPIVFVHPLADLPGGQTFAIAPIPQNTGGGGATVNAGAFVSMRLVADLGAWDNARQGIPLGQSGDPHSPHWTDQLASWEAVAPMAFPFTRAAIEQAATAEMEFLPPERNAGGRS